MRTVEGIVSQTLHKINKIKGKRKGLQRVFSFKNRKILRGVKWDKSAIRFYQLLKRQKGVSDCILPAKIKARPLFFSLFPISR
jgi:hypothetical protein